MRETELLVYAALLSPEIKTLKEKAINAICREIIQLCKSKRKKNEETLKDLKNEILKIKI